MMTRDEQVSMIRFMLIGVGLVAFIHLMMMVVTATPDNPGGNLPFWSVFVVDATTAGLIAVSGVFLMEK